MLMTFFMAIFLTAPVLGFTSEKQIGWLTDKEIKIFEKKAVIWIINSINTEWKKQNSDRQLIFDETKPLPKVLTERHITILDFINIMHEMHPGSDFNHIKFLTPMFIYHKNQIVVSVYNNLHSLVHELVHYVQKEYRNAKFKDFGAAFDWLEYDAINWQRKWEKEYKNKKF